MTSIPTLLEELDALAEKATPGPIEELRYIRYTAALANAYPLLRAEILRLREALEPFARAEVVGGSIFPSKNEYSVLFRDDRRLESADFRRARAALKGVEGGE